MKVSMVSDKNLA